MHAWFLCKDRADSPASARGRFGDRMQSAESRYRINRKGPRHETDNRDCRRRTSGVLHHLLKRGVRRRQAGPQRRRPELFVQRPGRHLARRALRRDQAAMRRKILRQLLRRQVVVGDVKTAAATAFVIPAKAGTYRVACQVALAPFQGWPDLSTALAK